MQLCRKNNIIIINATKHKGTIEEEHSHIETPGLVGDQGKTPQRGKPFQVLIVIECFNKERVQ